MTVITSRTLADSLDKIVADFQDNTWLLYLLQEFTAQGGPQYPRWGTVSRLFCWLTVYCIGTMVVFFRIFRNADLPVRLGVAGLLGLGMTVVIGALGTPGIVHGGLSRYIWLAPVFIIPAIIDILLKSAARKFILTAVCLLLLLPNFLSNADTVSRDITYLHELKAGQMLASCYGSGEELTYYSNGPGLIFPLLFTPEAVFRKMPEGRGITEEQIWKGIETKLAEFFDTSSGDAAFISSWKDREAYQEKAGVKAGDPKWGEMEKALSRAAKICDNRYLQVYVPSSTLR